MFIDSRAYLLYSFFGMICLLWMDRKGERAETGRRAVAPSARLNRLA